MRRNSVKFDRASSFTAMHTDCIKTRILLYKIRVLYICPSVCRSGKTRRYAILRWAYVQTIQNVYTSIIHPMNNRAITPFATYRNDY